MSAEPATPGGGDAPKINLIVTPEDRVATKKRSAFTDTVVCTACSQRLDAYRLDWMRRHPLLDVLLCKRCYTMQTSKEIQVGEDGMDEACRWCALEGDLICCDFCHNVFCKLCIRRNLGRAHLNIILNADEDQKWQCYVCNPEPLVGLVNMCTEIIQAAEEEYESKPPAKKMNLGPEDADSGGSMSASPRPKRGRKPGSTFPKKNVEATSKADVEESAAVDYVQKNDGDNVVARDEEEEEFPPAEEGDEEALVGGAVEGEGEEGEENQTSAQDQVKDNEVVYIKTPSGEIVALKATSTSSAEVVPKSKPLAEEVSNSNPTPVQKKPKSRSKMLPPKEGQTPKSYATTTAAGGQSQGKKYPRSVGQHRNTPGSLAAVAGIKLSSRPPVIDERNIWFILEKLLAATQSMTMLLASLKEDLKRTTTIVSSGGGSGVNSRNPELRKKRCEIAGKLWRAFLAYKKSFIDLETSSKNPKMQLESSQFFDENLAADGYDDYNEAGEDYYEGNDFAEPPEEEEDLAEEGEEPTTAAEQQLAATLNGNQQTQQLVSGSEAGQLFKTDE